MPIDYRKYLRRTLWTLEDAASLIAGIDLVHGGFNIANPLPNDLDRAKLAGEILENLITAATLGDVETFGAVTGVGISSSRLGEQRIRPTKAVAWAKKKGYPIPDQLMSLVEPEPVAPAGKRASTEKQLLPNERNTLLTIIAVLCEQAEIDLKTRGTASLIAKLSVEFGAPVSEDSVKRVIEKIAAAVESRRK